MGLLLHQFSNEFKMIVEEVYQRHFEVDPNLREDYSDYQKKRMKEDIEYNLSFLQIAYSLNDYSIFREYSIWLMSLMMNLMPQVGLTRMKENMITHYQIMKAAFEKTNVFQDLKAINYMLDDAIFQTEIYEYYQYESFVTNDRYDIVRRKYLDYLLNHDSRSAMKFIMEVFNKGYSLDEIYIDVIQKVMIEVGQLWHQGKITVADEHFITVATQSVLSQFYPIIFSVPKKITDYYLAVLVMNSMKWGFG